MEIEAQNDLVRERDFYRAKTQELGARVKTLEFDNAELVKRDQDITRRISELSNRGANRPRGRR